jgi:hypothetical protein
LALEQTIYKQRNWEPLINIEDTIQAMHYRDVKANLDVVMQISRDGYYNMERQKDPETGLTDD